MTIRPISALAAGAALLFLTACGGGEQVSQTAQLDYSNTAEPRHSYAPYRTRSHVFTWRGGSEARQVHIGGDVEPRENLRHFRTENGIRYFMGAVRDGVGVERLKNYEHDLITQDETDRYGLDGHGFLPFIIAPHMYLDRELLDSENADILSALVDSVLILNDALPPEFQIEIKGAVPPTTTAPAGSIVVNLDLRGGHRLDLHRRAVACAINEFNTVFDYTRSSVVHVPDDLDTSGHDVSPLRYPPRAPSCARPVGATSTPSSSRTASWERRESSSRTPAS